MRMLIRLLPFILLPFILLATAGCDLRRHDYVIRYQETAIVAMEVAGQTVLLTARAAFADEEPAPRSRRAPDDGMTADDRYRYVCAHPEIYGPIGSRQEYEVQFGDETAAGAAAVAAGGSSLVDLVISGPRQANATVAPQAARLERGGRSWSALDADVLSLTVGPAEAPGSFTDGPPARLHFPALPAVAPVAERLTQWQITHRAPPPADPIEITVALELDGRPCDVTFRFERVAEHPPFPPNPFYWLYAAH